MAIWEAVLLGVIQGVFMFFPVSSTSHLVLVQHALLEQGSALPPPESAEMILFDLVVHVGTVVSIMIVLRASLRALLAGAARDVRALLRPSGSRRMGLRLSRSGMTIAVALFLGLRRRWAAEYSFFVAIPTILAGAAVQALIAVRGVEGLALSFSAFAVGFVVAAVVGVAALTLVLRLLYQARFRYFAYYVWTLAVVVLLVLG